jgi:hypothetical protein
VFSSFLEFFKAAFDRGDKVIINAGDSEEDRKSFSETFPNADPYSSTTYTSIDEMEYFHKN